VRIAVDAMGGDHAPNVNVDAAIAASREFGIPTLLVGSSAQLQKLLLESGYRGTDRSDASAQSSANSTTTLPRNNTPTELCVPPPRRVNRLAWIHR